VADSSRAAAKEFIEPFFLSDSISFLLDFVSTGMFSVFSSYCMGGDTACLEEEG
jgi:hypothetical protein